MTAWGLSNIPFPQLKAQFGLKSVDVIMPSHMHDDHLNGFPHLVRHHGAKVWCYENMVDVLQNPRNYNLGCILGEPIKIDRAFATVRRSSGRNLSSRFSIRPVIRNTRWRCS